MTKQQPLGNKELRFGFTLIEILTSVAVLAMLVLLIVQIMGGTARTTQISNRAVDAAAQARLAFDRIGMDLAALVNRSDVDFQTSNTSGSNQLLLLSSISSPDSLSKTGIPGGNRGESIVGYKIAPSPDNIDVSGASRICLLRGTVPIGWNDSGFMGFSSGGALIRFTDPSAASYLPAVFDVLAPGVLQMVVGFQLYPDNQSVILMDGSKSTGTGQIVYSAPVRTGANYIDLSRVSAIVVGLVVLDTETLKLLRAADATSLAAVFKVPANGQWPVQTWASLANNAGGLGTSPLPVRQAVRVYQRFYPITPNGSR